MVRLKASQAVAATLAAKAVLSGLDRDSFAIELDSELLARMTKAIDDTQSEARIALSAPAVQEIFNSSEAIAKQLSLVRVRLSDTNHDEQVDVALQGFVASPESRDTVAAKVLNRTELAHDALCATLDSCAGMVIQQGSLGLLDSGSETSLATSARCAIHAKSSGLLNDAMCKIDEAVSGLHELHPRCSLSEAIETEASTASLLERSVKDASCEVETICDVVG